MDCSLSKEELKKLGQNIRNCRKCRLEDTRENALPGEGNPDSRVMLIAQAPGEVEDREGKMFIGPTGKKLDELFERINLSRNEIWMTNLIKCMLPDYRPPKKDEIDACSEYLEREIEIISPDTLVPLGYYSTRYVLNITGLPAPESKEKYTDVYGNLYFNGNIKVMPLKHPTAMVFDENIMGEMEESYRRIKTMLEECKWYDMCPMKRLYEQGLLEKKWVELYCMGDWKQCVRFELEEKGEPHPDWMLPDGSLRMDLKEKILKRWKR